MMSLDDLKNRITTILEDDVLQVRLDDAIDFVCGYLNQEFTEDNPMPNRVKKIVAKYVESESMFTDGVKSESIGGMSQVFESREERDKAFKSQLRATGLKKLRW